MEIPVRISPMPPDAPPDLGVGGQGGGDPQSAAPRRPYRWGMFQGWGAVAESVALVAAGLKVTLFGWSGFAAGFLIGLGDPATAPASYSSFWGLISGQAIILAWAGVAILRRSRWALVLAVYFAVFNAGLLSLYGLVVWALSVVYYYRRWPELGPLWRRRAAGSAAG